MKIYKIVHTTGNSHPGGDSGGFCSAANVSMPPDVKSAASTPTPSGTARQSSNFLH